MIAGMDNQGRKWVDTGRGLRLVVSGFTGDFLPGVRLRWDCKHREWLIIHWGRVVYRGQLHRSVVAKIRAAQYGSPQ